MSEVRVAAVGDIHVNEATAGEVRSILAEVSGKADILVLCGDLTNRGLPHEAEILVDALSSCRIPVVAVLGNHDFESGESEEIVQILCHAGVRVLDEEPHEIETVGFAGVKGFCGGFDRHTLSPFGEKTIKEFVHEAVDDVLRLESGLARLRTPHKIAVLHYSPIRATVDGEPLEIFPFLGTSRLADPLDHFPVSAAVHGHAHNGSPEGKTSGGVPVYNVAYPLMRKLQPEQPYRIIDL